MKPIEGTAPIEKPNPTDASIPQLPKKPYLTLGSFGDYISFQTPSNFFYYCCRKALALWNLFMTWLERKSPDEPKKDEGAPLDEVKRTAETPTTGSEDMPQSTLKTGTTQNDTGSARNMADSMTGSFVVVPDKDNK